MADIQGPGLYLIDSYGLKAVPVAAELHSEVIFTKNHNCIGRFVEMSISFWGKTHGRLWTDTCYIE